LNVFLLSSVTGLYQSVRLFVV